jgi:hypothetical protein
MSMAEGAGHDRALRAGWRRSAVPGEAGNGELPKLADIRLGVQEK